MRSKQLFISLTLGLGLTLALLWLLDGATLPVAHAATSQCPGQRPLLQAGGVITVCLSGGCDYASIQAAVDAASSGDEILVATGTYTGVSARTGVTQVAYISKTVAIRGGYTTTNWTTPYPITQPTTLDAQGQGRVLYITGDISPTVEGLRITGGNAGGPPSPKMGDGGGIYIITAAAAISNNQVFSNAAYSWGGGLAGWESDATLSGNIISGNKANKGGSGLFLVFSAATVNGNVVVANTTITGYGGGLYLGGSLAVLSGNLVTANVASRGGGLYVDYYSDPTLSGNTVISNTADRGGGLYVLGSGPTLGNNVIADNRANNRGGGLYIEGSSPYLLHITIARNTGGDGSGIYVTDGGWSPSIVVLTNTILVSHTVGITVTGRNTVTVNGVLWYGTPVTVSQAATATVTVQNQHEGDPALAADGYHLTGASAAINQGVSAGVATDIDGQTRDAIPDLGADEHYKIYLPLIMRQYQ